MLRGTPKDVATETARRVLAGLDIAPGDLSKLADLPAEKLMTIQLAAHVHFRFQPGSIWRAIQIRLPDVDFSGESRPGNWGPVVDGTYLPRDPFNPAAPPLSANIPLIIGNTHDEMLLFIRENVGFFHADEVAVTQNIRQRFGDQADRILAEYRKTMPTPRPVERAVAILTASPWQKHSDPGRPQISAAGASLSLPLRLSIQCAHQRHGLDAARLPRQRHLPCVPELRHPGPARQRPGP